MLRVRNSKSWPVVLLLAGLLLLMAFRQAPLLDAAPIAVPSNASRAQVEHVIGTALTRRNWRIIEHVPGEIDAVYNPRDFSVTIAVHSSARRIRIHYVTSSNLRYEVRNGVRYIHANYASWIQNLVTDISNELTMAT